MNTDKILILARKHVGNGGDMDSSARFCLTEAARAVDEGRLNAARMWAIKSLAYSVGIFHPDHKRASAVAQRTEAA